MQPSLPLLAALPVLFCAPFDVLVVNPSAGPFTDIQAAVDAAAERDTILVQSGTYTGFQVADKWLTIAGDSGTNVYVNGGIRVRDLAPGKRVTLIGLGSSGTTSGSGSRNGLHLMSNQGAVRVTRCDFQGGFDNSWEAQGSDGVLVESSVDVSLSRCTSLGGLASIGYTGPRGGAGIRLIQSSATVYDCTFEGAHGRDTLQPPYTFDAGPGGHGGRSQTSQLFASHTTFRGGDGGDAGLLIWGATFGGEGGHGLSQQSASATAVSPTLIGGAGGYDGPGSGGPSYAPDGQPWVGASPVILPAPFQSMSLATNPIREGTTQTITLSTQPGDRVALVVSGVTTSTFNAAWNGQQLFPSRGFTTTWHGVGSSSVFNLPIPDLGPGVQARTFLLQAVITKPGGSTVLSTPMSMLVLDSAF